LPQHRPLDSTARLRARRIALLETADTTQAYDTVARFCPAARMPPFVLDARMRIYPDYGRDIGLSPAQAEELTKLLRQKAPDVEIQALLGWRYAEFKARSSVQPTG